MVIFPFFMEAGWNFSVIFPLRSWWGSWWWNSPTCLATPAPCSGLLELCLSFKLVHAQSPAISQLALKCSYQILASERVSEQFLCQVSFGFLCLLVALVFRVVICPMTSPGSKKSCWFSVLHLFHVRMRVTTSKLLRVRLEPKGLEALFLIAE